MTDSWKKSEFTVDETVAAGVILVSPQLTWNLDGADTKNSTSWNGTGKLNKANKAELIPCDGKMVASSALESKPDVKSKIILTEK